MKQEKIIKSISYNQHEIIHNILYLHNQGKGVEVDITYCRGNFYGNFQLGNEQIYIPEPKFKLDVEPLTDDITRIEPLGKLPFSDSSVKSIIFDPPFVIQSEKSVRAKDPQHAYMSKRFNFYHSIDEMLQSYFHWIKEMNRVLENEGIIIIKCQPQVRESKHIYTNHFIWLIAESMGLALIDSFTLLAKSRQLTEQKQKYSRSYESFFLVFKKTLNNKFRYLSPFTEPINDRILKGFKENNEKRDRIIRNIDSATLEKIRKRQSGKDIGTFKRTVSALRKKGYSNRKIADALKISESKIRYWLRHQ